MDCDIASVQGTVTDENKVIVLFKNVGSAPIMNKRKFKLDTTKTVADTVNFLRKVLKVDIAQSIFIYINQSFAPSLDQTVDNLYNCYGCDNKLVLHYAITPAWG